MHRRNWTSYRRLHRRMPKSFLIVPLTHITMKTLLFVALCLLGSRGASAQLSPADEKAIRGVATHWVANLNDHRFEEMRTYTTPTLTMVNVMGMAMHGQAQVIQGYQRLFDALYMGVPFQQSDVVVSAVSPDAAVVSDVVNRGPAPSDSVKAGTPQPSRRAQKTMFLVKQQGRWLIAAAQSTIIDANRIKMATAAMTKK